MWTANAATFTPSLDALDHKAHITPANLISTFHRSLETQETAQTLQNILPNTNHFIHHSALSHTLPDEGAANHIRLSQSHSDPGIHLFVYGKSENTLTTEKYPRRHSLQASEAIAHRHHLSKDAVIFAQQSALAIDSGVFHNDVICTGNENLLLCHEFAFENQQKTIEALRNLGKNWLHIIEFSNQDLPIEEAVRTYFFNSQLITLPNNSLLLLLPSECKESPSIQNSLLMLKKKSSRPIQIQYVTVNESMKNGGGPACLRLRLLFNNKEEKSINPSYIFSDSLFDKLTSFIHSTYPDILSLSDLKEVQFKEYCEKVIADLKTLFE